MASQTFGSRLRHAWNAFLNRDPPGKSYYGGGYSYRPDRVRLNRSNDRTILTAIYTRIAMDAASITMNHVRLDENGRYDEAVDSGLNSCLNLSANKDQTGRALRYDMFLSMLDEGVVAVVPVDIDMNPGTGEMEIQSMRVGKVKEWYPDDVRVELYNDRTGQKEEVTLPKKWVALIENPFYAVMNEPNGTIQRLIRKLNLMDVIDEQVGSDKLDMIIQLPYTVRTDIKKKQAEERLKDLEEQLAGSKYGIAYADATEHITQLNRSLENNLLKTVEYLTNMAYSQLGLTPEIMNGTADDKVMTNYENRTIEPIVAAAVDEMRRKFLTNEDRANGESVMYFRDPFKLAPVSVVAEMADKFTRNEIMTSNEFRQVIGMKPSKDPKADELRNSNISRSNEEITAQKTVTDQGRDAVERSIANQNG
nr:MAG TPA: portal protein [Caudoviricetes sp.]